MLFENCIFVHGQQRYYNLVPIPGLSLHAPLIALMFVIQCFLLETSVSTMAFLIMAYVLVEKNATSLPIQFQTYVVSFFLESLQLICYC